MLKSFLPFAIFICASAIATGATPPDSVDLEQREKQLRETLATKSTETVDRDDDLTVRALVSIIDEESKRGGNNSNKHRALRELGKHPDSTLAIQTLIREIEFDPPKVVVVSDPLRSYTAATALTKMGPLARRALIRGLRKPLAEPELHLRAHVLGRMDWDVDEGIRQKEMILHRLRRELLVRKGDPEPPGEKEAKATVVFNLERMISILDEPGFFARRIPVSGDEP